MSEIIAEGASEDDFILPWTLPPIEESIKEHNENGSGEIDILQDPGDEPHGRVQLIIGKSKGSDKKNKILIGAGAATAVVVGGASAVLGLPVLLAVAGSAAVGAGYGAYRRFEKPGSKLFKKSQSQGGSLPFKYRTSLAQRQSAAADVRAKFPIDVFPIILEKHKMEKQLPRLNDTMLLVTGGITIEQFCNYVKGLLKLSSNRTLHLAEKGKVTNTASRTMLEIHSEHVDQDGFLYFTYLSQDTFWKQF